MLYRLDYLDFPTEQSFRSFVIHLGRVLSPLKFEDGVYLTFIFNIKQASDRVIDLIDTSLQNHISVSEINLRFRENITLDVISHEYTKWRKTEGSMYFEYIDQKGNQCLLGFVLSILDHGRYKDTFENFKAFLKRQANYDFTDDIQESLEILFKAHKYTIQFEPDVEIKALEQKISDVTLAKK